MRNGLGLSLAAGLASGLLFLSVLAGGGFGALFIYVTPLPLMMAGLCYGFPHAIAGSMVGLAMVGAFSGQAIPAFGVLAVVSTLVVVRQALLWRVRPDGTLEWYPPGLVLAWLAGVALGLLLLGMAFVANGSGGVEATVHQHVAEFAADLLTAAPADMRDAVVGVWTSVLPAVAAGGWLVVAVVNGTLGQWLASKSGRAVRPMPAYGDVEAPVWLALALGGAALLALAGSGDVAYVAKNAAMALLLPQVLVGLAEVHRLLGRRGHGKLWLTAFYVMSIAMFGWAMVAVAGLGLMKLWTRRRHDPGRGQEEE